MPTWATGASERQASGPRCEGISLIELLVALAILATLAGAVVLAFPDLLSRGGENTAARLQALIELACERAELSGRDIGIAVSAQGVAFGPFRDAAWEPLSDDPAEPLRPRRIDPPWRLTLRADGRPLALTDTLPEAPQLACLTSGELTPFVLELHGPQQRRWRIEGQAGGRIERERSDAG